MMNFNWVFKIWLTSFLITSGAWLALENGVLAQSAGTITIDNSQIVLNGTTPTDSITTNRGDISGNPTNSASNGGNITITVKEITLVKKVPEPSLLGGMVFAAAVAVSRLKQKRK